MPTFYFCIKIVVSDEVMHKIQHKVCHAVGRVVNIGVHIEVCLINSIRYYLEEWLRYGGSLLVSATKSVHHNLAALGRRKYVFQISCTLQLFLRFKMTSTNRISLLTH